MREITNFSDEYLDDMYLWFEYLICNRFRKREGEREIVSFYYV